MTFSFYSTPGHGYLRVPKKTFLKLGGNPEDISQYSGHDTTTLYLEEDCDACDFIDLVRENGMEFKHKIIHKENFSITHNYNPKLFDFNLEEGVDVELCNGDSATIGYYGSHVIARTTKGFIYKIPKTNPFKYITG